jgi:hypothetical protein
MAAATTSERKKRTITEIRDSKKTGEKMVYTSVLITPRQNGPKPPAWTSAWSAIRSP